MDINFKEIELNDIDSLLDIALKFQKHNPNGPQYSMLHKQKALQSFGYDKNLDGIYHLSESHFPTLRNRTTYCYQRNANDTADSPYALSKNFIEFQCDANYENGKQNLLTKIKEMPSEWTLVQMTAVDLKQGSVSYDVLKQTTPEFYLTVFKCGTDYTPISVNIQPPKLNEKPMELSKELREIIGKYEQNPLVNENDLEQYRRCREECNLNVKKIVYQMEFHWLRKWRFLLLGKLINSNDAEKIVLTQVYNILKEFNFSLSNENKTLLESITLASSYLSLREIASLIFRIIPNNKALSTKLSRTIGDISQFHSTLLRSPRHPVILILDQQLDYFPWEACEVLKNHPVSRLPSIHFVYGLFMEYKTDIVNGLVTNIRSSKGSYVINPGKDLNDMELRMHTFFEYWTQNWQGHVGEIESDTYQKLLVDSDIFCYNGHGSGLQFLSGDTIQKLRLKGVVMLFGCESVAFSESGVGFCELRGTYDNYLMACSACVVGNLYKVTSREMDLIATNLLSILIPSSNVANHWKHVDKNKWNSEGIIAKSKNFNSKESVQCEPELLRAICLAKQTSNIISYLNELALVVRGLPVIIK